MPVYHYQAVDSSGRNIRGAMTADDEGSLEEKLKTAGCWLLDAEREEARLGKDKTGLNRLEWLTWWGRTRRRDLIEFCTLMGFQTKVGIPLLQALEVAREDCENPRFAGVIEALERDVAQGFTFSEALEKHPKVFPPQFVAMSRAGEMSSKLPETFIDLKNYLEWLEQIIADVRQASLYPTIVLTVVSGFVLFLFTYIIPKFALLLQSTNAELPFITQVVFGASDFAKNTWWLWLGALVLLLVTFTVGRRLSPAFARAIDQGKINLPVFGELNLMLSISRFTHNLSVLYRSGIPIIQCLKVCKGLVGNAVVEKAVDTVEHSVDAGDTVSEAMRREPVFPSILLRMVVLGETTGGLDTALDHVSEYYNQIIPRRIKKIFTIMEPAIMLFLIFMVGAVALSIFLPILTLMNAIK